MMFYSKTAGCFYDTAIHGTRRISIVDPAWERPRIDVVLQPGESYKIYGEETTNTSDVPVTLRDVPDMNAEPDHIEVANPDCLIPIDAVEITVEQHAALLEGQAHGKRIVGNDAGVPVLVDPPQVPFATLAAQYMSTVRATREKIFSRLMNIATEQVILGNGANAQAIPPLCQALRDLPQHPSVMAAANFDALRTAVKTVYKSIAASAPEWLRSAFNEVDS